MAENGGVKRLKSLLKPSRSLFRRLLILSMFINLLALAVPVFVLQVYDRVIFHAGLSTLQGLSLGMLILLLFYFLLARGRARVLQATAVVTDIELEQAIFNHLLSLPLGIVEAKPASHWHNLFRDAELVRARYSGPIALLTLDLPFALLAFGLVSLIAEPVIWVLSVAIAVNLTITLISGRSMRKKHKIDRDSSIHRDRVLTEIMEARNTVKSIGMNEGVRNRWSEGHSTWVENSLKRGNHADFYRDLNQTLSMALIVAMTVVGALAILQQEMTMGALIAANMLGSRVIAPLNQLIMQWRGIAYFEQARSRLAAFFTLETDEEKKGVKFEQPNGEILLEDLCYRFDPEHDDALSKVSTTIGPKGMYSVIGPNGSGKSTLLKLIAGLYRPTGGRILIDGSDIAQFSQQDLSQKIGMLPQIVHIFSGTIRENIVMSRPDATDEEVIEAAKLVGLHTTVTKLPEGYGTVIGEDGYGLSGGERKRICLAAVFLKKPAILLLDEPTGDIDLGGEMALKESLLEFSKQHTVVVVTHSPHLLGVSDGIIALENGHMTIAGHRETVLKALAQ